MPLFTPLIYFRCIIKLVLSPPPSPIPDIQQSFITLTMIYVIDELWGLRNYALHNGANLAFKVQQENLGKSTRVLPSLTAELQNPKQLHNLCGTPPPHGWIEVNSDAATATSSTATAAVARNSTGMVVMVNSHVVVQNASLEGWSQVIFESDSKECIDPLSSNLPSVWTISNVISNISTLVESFNRFSFSWVRRSGNSAAHVAAKLSLNSGMSLSFNNDKLP